MLKRVLAILFLLMVFSVTGFLIHSALQPEKLPMGSSLPPLSYLSENGTEMLRTAGLNRTMVVYFNSECEFCHYQLSVIEDNLTEFRNVSLFLLTPEVDFFDHKKMDSWPRLKKSPNVFWGHVNATEFKRSFGIAGYPTSFFFDKEGILYAKLAGEAKLERIVHELEKHTGGPEHQVSSNN